MVAVVWHIQSLFLLNHDVAWLTHASNLLLQGGSYTQNFFETNPPLILYLYAPIVLLTHYLNLHIEIVTRFYIICLIGLSVCLSTYYVKTAVGEQCKAIIFMICLSIIYLVLPLNEFGQREHLSVLFIMPYFLLMASRLNGYTHYPISHLIVIGLMAGIGFALKPFFLCVYALLAIYFFVNTRKLKFFLNVENIWINVFIMAYLSLIYIYHQDYLNVILPLISKFYYSLYTQPMSAMLLTQGSLFTYFVVLVFLYHFFQSKTLHLENILFLSVIGFWMVFVIQRTDWYYHELPALACNVLVLTLCMQRFLVKDHLNKSDILSITLFSILMLMFCYRNLFYVNVKFPFYLQTFFCGFLWVFTWIIFYAQRTSFFKALGYSASIVLISFAFYHYLLFTDWFIYRFILTLLLMFLMLALVVPHSTFVHLNKWLLLSVFGFLLYSYPLYRGAYVTAYANNYHKLYKQFIKQMLPYQHRSIYYFTYTSELIFPMVYYNQQQYVSRFWSMVWTPIVQQPDQFASYHVFYQQHHDDFEFYINAIIADFKQNLPQVVLVDDRVHSQNRFYGAKSPDFIKLFSENRAFKHLWQHYHLIQILDYPPLCRFSVYQRMENL